MSAANGPAGQTSSAVLAAEGGLPVRTRAFPDWPQVDDQVRAALADVVGSGHWWQAEWRTGRVEELERFLTGRFHVAGAVPVMNGTTALELAFGALGLGSGDEVLVPATTFITTANAVLATGATPVPVDVERDTLHIDVTAIESAITLRTRAVAPVHLSGDLVDMIALQEVAGRYGLDVVEDAAQALGARRAGAGVASLGTLTALSFQAAKLLPGGEGGAVLVRGDRPGLVDTLHQLAHCGVPRGAPWYAHETIGSNRRMTEFQAAAVLSQVPRAAERARLRSTAAAALARALPEQGLGIPMCTPLGTESTDRSMFWFWLPEDVQGRTNAVEVSRLLSAEGVPAAPMYPAWHLTVAYRDSLPPPAHPTTVAQDAGRNAVWLHHRLLLDGVGGVSDIVTALAKVMGHIRARTPAGGA